MYSGPDGGFQVAKNKRSLEEIAIKKLYTSQTYQRLVESKQFEKDTLKKIYEVLKDNLHYYGEGDK